MKELDNKFSANIKELQQLRKKRMKAIKEWDVVTLEETEIKIGINQIAGDSIIDAMRQLALKTQLQ